MGTVRRRDLKPVRKQSDEEFLRRAQASATRAQNRLAKQRRAEGTRREIDRTDALKEARK